MKLVIPVVSIVILQKKESKREQHKYHDVMDQAACVIEFDAAYVGHYRFIHMHLFP